MVVLALSAWILTASLGLYMLTTWLIEDDGNAGRRGYRHLRAPVVFSHAGLALGGLIIYVLYLYVDNDHLAWVALIILAAVATLGLIMFTRWVPVHRLDKDLASTAAQQAANRSGAAPGSIDPPPAEHTFPLQVVVLHGIFAILTIALVLLIALGFAG
jgi:hypothetical protein